MTAAGSPRKPNQDKHDALLAMLAEVLEAARRQEEWMREIAELVDNLATDVDHLRRQVLADNNYRPV